MNKIYIEQIGEFGLIDRIKKLFPQNTIPIGIGDDCAQIPNFKASPLITTDSIVEGVHFLDEWNIYEFIGSKIIVSGSSDISAMGGIPLYFLLNLTIPPKTEIAKLDLLFKGIMKKAKDFKIELIGGNISAGRDLAIHITVIGEGENIVTRSDAQIGDHIFVTGKLGGSKIGLEILKNNSVKLTKDVKENLVNRFLNPQGRIFDGKKLAQTGCLNSMIDISDGLIADLKHILDMSKVGAKLKVADILLLGGVREYCQIIKKNPIEYILDSGEEYELLFTVKRNKIKEFEELVKSFKFPITKIGEIIQGNEIKGIDTSLLSSGYKHF